MKTGVFLLPIVAISILSSCNIFQKEVSQSVVPESINIARPVAQETSSWAPTITASSASGNTISSSPIYSNDCLWLKVNVTYSVTPWVFFGKSDNTDELLLDLERVNPNSQSYGKFHILPYNKPITLTKGDLKLFVAIGEKNAYSPPFFIIQKGNILFGGETLHSLENYNDWNGEDLKYFVDKVSSYGDFACKNIKTWQLVYVRNSSNTKDLDGYIKEELQKVENSVEKIDKSKSFNIDEYLDKGTYSVVQKLESNEYLVLTVDPNKSATNTSTRITCEELGGTSCVNFILKDNKLLYTNLKTRWKFTDENRTEDLWKVYKIGGYWVIFDISWGGWGIDEQVLYRSSFDTFTYINLHTLKPIYETYAVDMECKLEGNGECAKWAEKTTTKKVFCSSVSPDCKEINLKSTNIEDAYFEYYKEEKPAETPQ